jgi:hypothetical protein
MHDPRSPDLLAWIDDMPSAWDQAVTMNALCLAFPYLKVCGDWQEKLAVIEDAMHLTARDREDLMMQAAGMSARLKREMAG